MVSDSGARRRLSKKNPKRGRRRAAGALAWRRVRIVSVCTTTKKPKNGETQNLAPVRTRVRARAGRRAACTPHGTRRMATTREPKVRDAVDRKTMLALVRMSPNGPGFMAMAAEWEAGNAALRKARRRFEVEQEVERRTPSPLAAFAWAKRPPGVIDMGIALDIYRKELIAELERVDLHQDKRKALKKRKDEVFTELCDRVKAKDLAKKQRRESTAGGGFERQLVEREQLESWERKQGHKMAKEQQAKQFPSTVKGWSSDPVAFADAKLELELRGRGEVR